MAQNLSHSAVPHNDQNPTASHESYVSQNFPNFPPSGQNSSLNPYPTNITHDSYMAQHVSPFTAPNPTTCAQNMYVSQNFMNIPTSAQNSSIPQYPTNITHHSNMTYNVSRFDVPPIPQNLTATPQNAYSSQNYMNIPASAQNLPIPQNTTYNLAPSASYEQVSHFGEFGQNIAKNKGIIHFSHPHGLVWVNIKQVKKKITCSGCQQSLVGKGNACVEENCGFQVDESCFNLEKEIRHKSHPAHPLSLLSSSPYKNENGMFACGACFKNGSGFTYHCSICEYDLDITCANLKETVKRDDHQHVLKLYYEGPLNGEDYALYCDVCNRVVPRDHWAYYCLLDF
ncbi:zinc finger, PHD-type, C1-like protein [Tanacetum coccineum]